MMLAHDVVDDPLRHTRKNDHRQRAKDRAPERAQRQRRITLQVTEDAPYRFHLRASYHSSRCATSGWIGRSAGDAKKGRLRRLDFNIEQGIARSTISDVIAGMFMSIFEGEFGDARLIELAQTFRDHALVLFFGRARKR